MNIRGKDVFRTVKELPDEIVKGEAQPPGAHVAIPNKKAVEGVFHSASFVLNYEESLKKARSSEYP
jgi:hypothetical protein